MSQFDQRFRRNFLCGALLLSVLSSGCAGISTTGEKASRQQLSDYAEFYQRGVNAPDLPLLTAKSPLEDFLRYAALRRPEVERAYSEWAASVERITIARSLPDPVFTAGADLQDAFEKDLSNIIILLVGGLAIDLPGPGKLSARADLATTETQAAFAEFQSTAAEVALDTRGIYFDLSLFKEQSRILQQHHQLLEKVSNAVQRLEQAGLATRSEVLQVNRELAEVQNRQTNLADQRISLLSQWKSSLGILPDEPAPPEPHFFSFEPLIQLDEALLQEALNKNPRLAVLKAELEQAEASVAVAYKSRVPDFSLGFETETPVSNGSVKSRDTVFLPRVGVSLPIWRDKIAAEIAEAEALKRAAQSGYTAEQLATVREYARVTVGLRETTRNLSILDSTLIPAQRELVELAQRGYDAGVTTLFELIEQQRELLELEQTRAEGLNNQQHLASELMLTLLGRT